MDGNMKNQPGDNEKLPNQLQQGSGGDSMNIVGGTNSETLTAAIRCEETEIVSGEDGKSKSKMEALETSKEVSGEEEPKEISSSESEKHTWVIDMIDIKCDGNSRSLSDENLDREKVCRICHLSSDQTSSGSVGLIQLGCDCKDELGISHRYCAEAWFKRKGNRKCEICGGTAKNITGIEDTGFKSPWNEMRVMRSATNSSDRESSCCSCWGRQRFCNFLLACLILAFIFPWFFRMDIL